ncbi:M20 metallopeptidase family protein [Salirhabdus salicampi]|uniref:M20 metallopeptidase family protein n=1 Tax=Salirhabdus salicampi TaxID=476102 RepID=UPI0020C56A9D|nr:M20 family metallopeptidase [Salirhabdus salicampi]MCP8618138.1 M20 family metallopeptidase [Salirhabdus salicampi]
MLEAIFARLDEIHQEMIDIRRDLHMHPELSFQEVRTPQVIAEYQRRLGLDVQTEVGGRGVVATLHGERPGKTVAIRADFDALPIYEQNDVPYKSKNEGVMHACGHDAHTAIALGLAKVFSENKDQLEGNIVFIHQHAEEQNPGGAIGMIEDGCLDGVDVIFATHMENYFPVGKVIYSNGYILAASDRFEIEVKGVGGHGAFPQDTKDSVVIGSQIVGNLQQIISRRVDPLKSAVLTVGAFHSGEAPNVIAHNAIIKGTVRTFDEEIRNQIEKQMEDIVAYTCKASGADYKFEYDRGFPATWNHPEPTELLIDAAKSVVNKEDIVSIPPNMGGEDFSYFLQKVPGTYFFTGSANEEKGLIYPYHHPKFDIDEDALVIGAKTLASATIKYLKNNK